MCKAVEHNFPIKSAIQKERLALPGLAAGIEEIIGLRVVYCFAERCKEELFTSGLSHCFL